jgi:hypothetical protein
MQNTKTYTFERMSPCPLGLLDTIAVGFFDLIVICVAMVELNTGEQHKLRRKCPYFFDLAIMNVLRSGC